MTKSDPRNSKNAIKEKAADTPPQEISDGTNVRIAKGDVTRENDDNKFERSVQGRDAVADGAPYLSIGGPNKGKVLQPVRERGTGKLLSVPVEDLQRPERAKTRSVGYSHIEQDEWDRIFGSK